MERMLDVALVSIAVMAGTLALPGVPLRCWQLATGRLRARIPAHPLARATFSLFAGLLFVPAVLAWGYALYMAYADWRCSGACTQAGTGTAIALGLLGCAYALLEGFLLTARRPARRLDGSRPAVSKEDT